MKEAPKIRHTAYLMVLLENAVGSVDSDVYPQVPTLPRVVRVAILGGGPGTITTRIDSTWACITEYTADTFQEAIDYLREFCKRTYPSLYYWLDWSGHLDHDKAIDHHMRMYQAKPSPTF